MVSMDTHKVTMLENATANNNSKGSLKTDIKLFGLVHWDVGHLMSI